MNFMGGGRLMRDILLVEDDDDTREAFLDLLNDAGYRVTAATNGREALDMLHGEGAALVLVDLFMPVMDGAELIEAMRRDRALAHVPVIAITAASATAVPPGVRVLKKPFRLDEVFELIQAHCGRGRHSR
jgi:CheY-like chemotaxis protein